MSNQPQYQSILSRIKEANTGAADPKKKASGDQEAVHGIKDPADKGQKAVPEHPQGDDNKDQQRPADANQASGDPGGQAGEGKKLEDKDTNPGSTGTNVPATNNGKLKEDAATEPNTPISKIAKQSQSILAAIEAVTSSKSAAKTKEADGNVMKKEEASGKVAGQDDIPFEVTADVSQKIACSILANEERTAVVAGWLKEDSGAEKAASLIAAAQQEASEADMYAYKQAAYEQQLVEEFEALSPEEQEQIKAAHALLQQGLSHYKSDGEKQAFMGGAADAAAMMDAEAGGEEAMIPGGGEGELGPEEILALLEQLVASGQIPQEVAEQVAMELMTGEGGGMEPGMEPGMEAGAAPMPEEMKAASALVDSFTA
jgi:hypothetical protein